MRSSALLLAFAAATMLAGCSDEAPAAAPHDAGTVDTDKPGPPAEIPPEGLAGLPHASVVAGATFQSNATCTECHAAGSGVLRDAAGRDVSPSYLFPRSMMSLSARDPYWLAAISRELVMHPEAKALVQDVCTRCHAPAGVRELAAKGHAMDLGTITAATSVEGHLAREGVACTVCHQIQPGGLGEESTFDGQFKVGTQREIYGPHAGPLTMPMQNRVQYTPTAGAHMVKSELCASCHTVITRPLDAEGQPVGPEVNEQVPFLEWRNSVFSTQWGTTCQGCHMPTSDEDGKLISTVISLRPANGRLSARAPVGRHELAGGNAWMLELMAANAAWVGGSAPASELLAGAAVAEASLRRAATVSIAKVSASPQGLGFEVLVENLTGHKLPTGYPGRRLWLHAVVSDASGAVLFESGGHDASGALRGANGGRLDTVEVLLPHRDVVRTPDEVQVWESVLADEAGKPTHVLLDAWGYAKDDRILPRGWSAAHPDAERTKPVGADGDPSFLPGSDRVRFELPPLARAASIRVELLFESVPPAALDALQATPPTPAGIAFLAMARSLPPRPVPLATATAEVR